MREFKKVEMSRGDVAIVAVESQQPTPVPWKMDDLRIEKRNSKWGQEWVIWQNGIKLMGFFSERSALSAYKKLLKDPLWRG